MTCGETLNFASLSNDTAIPASTIREYYQILEDTFIGFLVPSWQKTVKRTAVSAAKFYFFDLGVKNALAQIQAIESNTERFGNALEHFIALELRAYISYSRLHLSLSYWRTTLGHEVDFIIGDDVAIEVKSTKRVVNKHIKGLNLLVEERICKSYYLVSLDPVKRKEGKVLMLPWRDFLDALWSGDII